MKADKTNLLIPSTLPYLFICEDRWRHPGVRFHSFFEGGILTLKTTQRRGVCYSENETFPLALGLKHALHTGRLLPRCLLASMLLVWGGETHRWVTSNRPPSHVPFASCSVPAARPWKHGFVFEILSHFSHLRWSLRKHGFWDLGVTSDWLHGLHRLACSHGCFSHLQ